ncbi:MAG: MAPEG family protein [Gammaproteobacteria bacterium]|nr:MAPEG family protein [Gammaproteobacteria bacterium]
MSPTTTALLGFISLTLALLGTLGILRVGLTLKGVKAPNSFDPSGQDVSPFAVRLCRTHANCYESFPFFGGLLLLAIAIDATAITDGLAYYFIGARVLQAVIHLASTSNFAVQVRFAFFLAQVVIAVMWILQFFKM